MRSFCAASFDGKIVKVWFVVMADTKTVEDEEKKRR